MAEDIASLGIAVDTTQLAQGERALDSFTDAGARAENQTEKLGSASAELAARQAKFQAEWFKQTTEAKRSSDAMFSASKEVQKLLDRYDPLGTKLRQLEADFSMLNKAAASGAIPATQDIAVDKTYRALNAEMERTKGLMVAAGVPVEGMANTMTKLGLNTRYAQHELMMLGKEALMGDFGRMPMTMGALLTHSSLLAAAFSPLGLAIGGVGAAAIAMTAAFFAGRAEMNEMNRALNMTGDYAGQTMGSMRILAEQIESSSSLTIGQTKDMATAIAGSGKIGADAYRSVMIAAAEYSRASGENAEKATQYMIKIFEDPAKGAERLNETMHFLGVEELNRIERMVEMGRVTEAQTALASSLTQVLKQQEDNVTNLAKAWSNIKKFASEAWDAMMGVGRKATTQDAAAALQRQIDAIDVGGGLDRWGRRLTDEQQKRVAVLRSQLSFINRTLTEETDAARGKAATAEQNRQDQENLKLAKNTSELEKNYQTRLKIGKLRGLTGAELEKFTGPAPSVEQVMADAAKTLEKQMQPRVRAARGSIVDTAKIELNAEIQNIKDKSAELQGTYANEQRVMEARHQAGLIEEKDYYQELRGYITKNADAQIDALEKENKAMEKATGLKEADRLRNVQSVAQNTSKIKQIREKSQADLEVVDLKEKASADRARQAREAAAYAVEQYLDSLRRRISREMTSYGTGAEERARMAGEYQILDDFYARRQKLIHDWQTKKYQGTEAEYQQELALINAKEQEALVIYRDGYQKRKDIMADWSKGAIEALQNYSDEVANVAKGTEEVFGKAMKGMEDALVDFVTTGKMDFKSLADSIVKDITRMVIRQNITGPFSEYLKGGIQSGTGMGGIFGNLFGNLFGSNAAPAASSYDWMTGENWTSSMPFISPIESSDILSGMFPAFQSGTDYVPRNMLAYVHKGEKVIPANENLPQPQGRGGKSVTVINNFTLQQPADRRTQDQIAVLAGTSIQTALARNG